MGVERKPVEQPGKSTDALEIGQKRFDAYRKYIPLTGEVAADAITKVCEETGLGRKQARRLALKFQELPVPETLAPGRRGPKLGSHRIEPHVKRAIDELILQNYLKNNPPSKALAAREIRNLLIADNGDHKFDDAMVPTVEVIVTLIEELTESSKARACRGSKSRTAHEAHPDFYDSEGFMDLVAMDHARGDAVLVEQLSREALDRPWITFLMEIYTRCIIGFYVSFGDPSIFRCGRAVVNALLPKQPLLEQMGLPTSGPEAVQYEMYGHFNKLHCDHAKPHKAKAFRSACYQINIDPDIRPKGPANYGTHIERLIGNFVGRQRLLIGSTGGDVSERDGYDPHEAAVMDRPSFERWLVLQIAIYHNEPHDGLGGMSPAHAWQKALQKHPTALLAGLPDVDDLTKRFLPSKQLTVHSYGVRILYRKYWHEMFRDMIGMSVTVRVDERNLNEVYLEWEGSFVTLRSRRSYPPVSHQEWEAARKRVREEEKHFQADGAHDATARYAVQARREIASSNVKTRSARTAKKRAEGEGASHRPDGSPAIEEEVVWSEPDDLDEGNWDVVDEW